MKCYFCKRQAVGTRGGLLTHYGLCRRHLGKGRGWFEEQLDKEEGGEECEDSNVPSIILIIIGLAVPYFILDLLFPDWDINIKAGISLVITIILMNQVEEIVSGLIDR